MVRYIRSFGAVMLMLCCAVAQADIFIFNVQMDGGQEVPANGSPGIGEAVVVFDDVTGNMTITGSYTGLTTDVNAAHLHGYSPVGVNSGVIFGLTHSGGTTGTLTGNGVIPAGNIADVMNGLTYINVHTTGFPGGEVRGQLINPIPEPSTLLALSAGAFALLFKRRR